MRNFTPDQSFEGPGDFSPKIFKNLLNEFCKPPARIDSLEQHMSDYFGSE